MKILITGASGYLGVSLCEYLKTKYKIIPVCRSIYDYQRDWINSFDEFIIGDITSKETIKKIANIKADVLIHLISLNDKDSETSIEKLYKINIKPTWDLLNLCSKKGLKKFIYFSTIHVYGKSNLTLIDENTLPNPKNKYALTHLISENIVNFYNANLKTECINLRLSNSFGYPKLKNPYSWNLIINDLCKSAIKNNKIVLKGDGTEFRDFIDHESICISIDNLITKKNNKDLIHTFNLSSGNSISLLEIAFIVQGEFEKIFNKQIDIFINNNVKINFLNKKSSANQIISNEKINKTISFTTNPINKEINSLLREILENG